MINAFLLLTRRFSTLLFCTVALAGCSHTPASLTAPSSVIAGSMIHGAAIQPGTALQTARIGHKEHTRGSPVVSCPGRGMASCEINWRRLYEGQTAAQVIEWLGEPTQRIGPDIYVNKIVAELRFEHKGVVFFKDEQLQYVDLPESFVYPL